MRALRLQSYANGSKQWDEFLKAVPEELMALASICRYKAGSTICLGESPVKYVHLVLTGTVSAQNVTVTGKVSNWLHMPSPTFIGDLEVLAERLQSYQVAVADRGIYVEAPADLELLADTDEAMAARILDNLLSNAVRYTPEGGLIRIELREEGQERGILIENFGVTIPDGLMPHVFEPFVTGSHQADSAGLHSHGLGLYIASYYAKKLEARLEVRNGEDSVVTLLIFPAGRELQ